MTQNSSETETRAILAVDAGSPVVSTAVASDGRVLAQRQGPGGRSSQGLVQMIDALHSDVGLEIGDLEGIVALRGPGSFTLAMECRPNSLEGDNLNLSMDGQYTSEGYVADAEYAYDQGTDREFRFLVRQTARYLGPCDGEEGAGITGG